MISILLGKRALIEIHDYLLQKIGHIIQSKTLSTLKEGSVEYIVLVLFFLTHFLKKENRTISVPDIVLGRPLYHFYSNSISLKKIKET